MTDAPLVVRVKIQNQIWVKNAFNHDSFGFMHILPNPLRWFKEIRPADILQYCFFAHSGDEVIKSRDGSTDIPEYDIDASMESVDEFFRDLYNSGLATKEEIVLWAKMRQM